MPRDKKKSAVEELVEKNDTKKKQGRPKLDGNEGEARSQRFSILVTPSVHQALKDSAWENHRTVNDHIYQILKEAMIKEGKIQDINVSES